MAIFLPHHLHLFLRMRLINIKTGKLEEVLGDKLEQLDYVILSHTWRDDEVTLQEFQDGKSNDKIQLACRKAADDGFDYIWIDTCCIDKSSSSELSEAVNSMYMWYKRSKICYAYIDDYEFAGNGFVSTNNVKYDSWKTDVSKTIPSKNANLIHPEDRRTSNDGAAADDHESGCETIKSPEGDNVWSNLHQISRTDTTRESGGLEGTGEVEHNTLKPNGEFFKCRWWTRGWTLQELIAPEIVEFYDNTWKEIGTKMSLKDSISYATFIPTSVLVGTEESRGFNIATRLSWAAGRRTTRVEDIAYCLLGLFDIHMPLLYGEGRKSFQRFQKELFRHYDDLSIFIWAPPKDPVSSPVLASSPDFFSPSQFSTGDKSKGLLPILRSLYSNPWGSSKAHPDRSLTPPPRMTSRELHIHLPLIKIAGRTVLHTFLYLAPVCWLPTRVLAPSAEPSSLMIHCILLQSISPSKGIFERYGGPIQSEALQSWVSINSVFFKLFSQKEWNEMTYHDVFLKTGEIGGPRTGMKIQLGQRIQQVILLNIKSNHNVQCELSPFLLRNINSSVQLSKRLTWQDLRKEFILQPSGDISVSAASLTCYCSSPFSHNVNLPSKFTVVISFGFVEPPSSRAWCSLRFEEQIISEVSTGYLRRPFFNSTPVHSTPNISDRCQARLSERGFKPEIWIRAAIRKVQNVDTHSERWKLSLEIYKRENS
jgi:heterokaryon incompatibility protein (HET)